MGSTGLGLLLEEHRSEIAAAWKQAVSRELGATEPALEFAVAPLLREMTLALGGEGRASGSREAWSRCAVLVRSSAIPARLAREFKLLHRCTWEALRARDVPVSPAARRAADEWLDEALAEALDRLERVRVRAAAFTLYAPAVIPAARPTAPPPLPARRATRPPPLPRRVPREETVIELEPIEDGRI